MKGSQTIKQGICQDGDWNREEMRFILLVREAEGEQVTTLKIYLHIPQIANAAGFH